MNPRVAPTRIGLSHPDDKPFDRGSDARAAGPALRASIVRLCAELSVRPKQRVGRDDRADLSQSATTHGMRVPAESSSLSVCETDGPLTELLAESSVLRLEIFDQLALLVIDPTGQNHEHELNVKGHLRRGGCEAVSERASLKVLDTHWARQVESAPLIDTSGPKLHVRDEIASPPAVSSRGVA